MKIVCKTTYLAAAVIVLGAVIIAGCGSRPPRWNVLLVTVDTLRADRLHCYGNNRIHTPAIDSLAAAGVLFDNAYAAIPVTLPSHTTILSGLYPHQHGVRDNGVYRVPDEVETIAEILARQGYETAGFVSAFVLDKVFRIDQGFETYDDEMDEPLMSESPVRPGWNMPDHTSRWVSTWTEPYQRRAEATVDRALEWFGGRDRSRKFFCWVHLFDPHLSYTPPAPWDDKYSSGYDGIVDGTAESFQKIAIESKGKIPREDHDRMLELYDGEVSYADDQLRRLFTAIPESTLVVFTSDHGEAFGEHGLFFEHQQIVYGETTRIPLIITGPGIVAGNRRQDLASSIDVVPTILAAIGLPIPRKLPGRSLLDESRSAEEGVYAEAQASVTAVPTKYGYRGVRTSDWSLIRRIAKPNSVHSSELFSLAGDPYERENLLANSPGPLSDLESILAELENLGKAGDLQPDAFWSFEEAEDDRRSKLEALGYIETK